MTTRTETLTDAEIINNLAQARRDDQTIRFLYRTYYDFLSRYVINNNGSSDDAADVFEEVIIAFLNLIKGGKFRGEASIKTFLYSLNKNIWLNELKKRGRSQARELKYEQVTEREMKGIDAVIENREGHEELMKTLDELGETCKQILLLYYYENQSMKEILATLHYENEQVVRNKKYKCLKRLEEMIMSNQKLYLQLKTLLHA